MTTAIDSAILDVYRDVGEFRRNQAWAGLDAMLMLETMDAGPDLAVRVAWLMATATIARDLLPHWKGLWDATYAQYVEERGEDEAIETLGSLK